MKVKEIMTETVHACAPETNLASAIALMWNGDCGTLPVLTDDGKVIGLITDRDIAMALGTRNKLASAMPVKEVMSKDVYACRPEDDIHEALNILKKYKVRRLPVLNNDGKIQGVLSLNDVALQAKKVGGREVSDLTYEDVVQTLKAVCEPRHPQTVTQSAYKTAP